MQLQVLTHEAEFNTPVTAMPLVDGGCDGYQYRYAGNRAAGQDERRYRDLLDGYVPFFRDGEYHGSQRNDRTGNERYRLWSLRNGRSHSDWSHDERCGRVDNQRNSDLDQYVLVATHPRRTSFERTKYLRVQCFVSIKNSNRSIYQLESS